MFEKFRFSFFNIFLFCVCFGLLFFVKVDSYALDRDYTVVVSSRNGTPSSPNGYSQLTTSIDVTSGSRVCIYLSPIGSYQGVNLYSGVFYSSVGGNYPQRLTVTFFVDGSNTGTENSSSVKSSSYDDSIYKIYPTFGNNSFNVSVTNGGVCPIFYDYADAKSYIINGTMPEKEFNEDLKLDKFKVISKGDWIQEYLNGKVEFNHLVVQPFWSDDAITSVEVSVYAADPAYNYNPKNWTYASYESGVFHDFDISGLTLHDQKFIVRATPYNETYRGVSIQYELYFPKDFDQPIGQLVIPTGNTYPYSTTLDISGNDVPIEWTVTQTPIYVYETNNIENYYYQEPVSYPVPEITQDTPDNYYTEYINNYYESYETVVNNYNTNFDFDFGDISSNDIQQGYDDVGDFLNGIGGLVSKVAQLFAGLFPFLSPGISVAIVAGFGLLIVIGGIVLFIKIIKAILP